MNARVEAAANLLVSEVKFLYACGWKSKIVKSKLDKSTRLVFVKGKQSMSQMEAIAIEKHGDANFETH